MSGESGGVAAGAGMAQAAKADRTANARINGMDDLIGGSSIAKAPTINANARPAKGRGPGSARARRDSARRSLQAPVRP
jgi:hypothetical protein